MESVDFVKLATNNGLALALLIVGGIVVYRLWQWAKPWVEKLFQSHLDTMGSISKTQQQLCEGQERQEVLLASALNNPKIDEIHSDTKDIKAWAEAWMPPKRDGLA